MTIWNIGSMGQVGTADMVGAFSFYSVSSCFMSTIKV